ncbi:hypothetical protein TNCV_419121 [Trichonephila clavipes]|uniref:Uncharacterized protein n=1 Tax=Trichonephila clavipes TaxID=2585209 RepID=A0A8X6SA06_TRICX|nr:hypothetical protein TNCV_419121 [Trichonephila clavipes]
MRFSCHRKRQLIWRESGTAYRPENIQEKDRYPTCRQVAGRNYPPTNKNTLIRALTEVWDKVPQQLLDNVVQSMVRRVECCIPLLGGHIPY